jgi:hypothetical protein
METGSKPGEIGLLLHGDSVKTRRNITYSSWRQGNLLLLLLLHGDIDETRIHGILDCAESSTHFEVNFCRPCVEVPQLTFSRAILPLLLWNEINPEAPCKILVPDFQEAM